MRFLRFLKSDFSVAIVHFGMKMHSNSTPWKFYRSKSIGDHGQSSLVSFLSTFSKDFSSETTGLIVLKFHMQPSGKRVKKVCIFGSGYIGQARHMPIYGKKP